MRCSTVSHFYCHTAKVKMGLHNCLFDIRDLSNPSRLTGETISVIENALVKYARCLIPQDCF